MGNHGSGKSTLVSKIADAYESINLVTDARKLTRQPVIMECSSADRHGLAVIGNYQMGNTSGIDSGRFAGRMDEIISWVEEYQDNGWNVLLEGMLVASMWRRFVDMKEAGRNVKVVCLDVSVEECAISVAHRKTTSPRRSKHTDSPVNVTTLKNKQTSVLSAYNQFVGAGVPVVIATRESAERELRRILGL